MGFRKRRGSPPRTGDDGSEDGRQASVARGRIAHINPTAAIRRYIVASGMSVALAQAALSCRRYLVGPAEAFASALHPWISLSGQTSRRSMHRKPLTINVF